MIDKEGLDEFPFVAERIAIELSNSLTGSEAGLRGFRNRGFVGRVVGGITGKNIDLTAQLFADHITAQKAVVSYLELLTETELHTQNCLMKVTRNLLHTINNVSLINNKLDKELLEVKKLMQEIHDNIQTQISQLSNRLKRNEQLEYLTIQFKKRKVHPGFPEVLNSALFFAHVDRLFVGESADYRKSKKELALYTIEDYLGDTNRPQSVQSILGNIISLTDRSVLEIAVYLTSYSNYPIINSLNYLFIRRLSGLEVNELHVRESLLTAQIIEKDILLKKGSIFTPTQMAEHLGTQLSQATYESV